MENNMTTEVNLNTRINGAEYNQYMFVDEYDENNIWLSMNVVGGRTHMTMTKDGAKELIAALTRILEAE